MPRIERNVELLDALSRTFRKLEDECLDDLDRMVPSSVVQFFSRQKKRRRISEGDRRLQKLRELLQSGFGVVRSPMQCDFHECFMAACARHIFSADESTDWARLMDREGWNDIRSVVLCQTPRRFGLVHFFVTV